MNQAQKIILIAAGDTSERADLVTLLKKGGNTILTTATAEDGIEIAKTQPIDVVILDLNEPALNGYGFLESLTNDVVLKKIPSFFVVAHAQEDLDINKNITLGVKDSIIKSSSTNADIETKLSPYVSNGSVSDPMHAEGFKILVVEDDNFLRDLLARKLGQENCQFMTAIDGENALKMIDQEKPSIILLDLILPGIDGFEVLSKIKQNPAVKDVPVVILSNLGQDSDIKKAKELGADDFLIKANFSIDEVIGKIKELIRK